jgi:hypothetical protein
MFAGNMSQKIVQYYRRLDGRNKIVLVILAYLFFLQLILCSFNKGHWSCKHKNLKLKKVHLYGN